MSTKSLWMIPGLVIVLAGFSPAQQPAASSVSEILGQHDRALIRELGAYLKQNPKADDRDQGFAALFNKAIEHDWFADNEEAALRYLKNDPDGPVKALAQIIATMARAQAGRHDEALARYKELMNGLGKSDQEDFATSFTETFATSAVTAGEFAIARQVYQALQERFPDSPGCVTRSPGSWDGWIGSASPLRASKPRTFPARPSGWNRSRESTSWSISGPPGARRASASCRDFKTAIGSTMARGSKSSVSASTRPEPP